jgi:hypothetical protein
MGTDLPDGRLPVISRAEIVAHWPVAALLCPLALAAVAPVGLGTMPAEQFATLAQLPLHMAHQVEEHANDRFRRFVNARFGAEVLTPEAVAVINLPGVWGVILASFLLGAFVDPGLALIAGYLSVVNALLHLAAWMALGRCHPGLVSALALLLPGGVLGIVVAGAAAGVAAGHHALALAVAAAIHAAIVLHLRARARG